MSNHLISAVYKRQLGSHMRKSVMALLADKASDDGSGIWASKQTLADELCCSKQTVIATIQAFIADGLLHEAGTRKCSTGATVEYRIDVAAVEALPFVDCHAKRSSTLTGQAASPVKLASPRGQAAGPKPSRTTLSSEANASSDTPARKIDPFPCPDGVDEVDWSSLIANRKAKRAALTPGAHRQIINKLRKWSDAGWPPGPIVAHAVELGWTTVFETDEMKGKANGRRNGLGGHQSANDGLSATTRAARDVFYAEPGTCVAGRVRERADQVPRLGGPGWHGSNGPS